MKKVLAVFFMVILALLWQISAVADNLPIIKDEAELLTEEEEASLYQEMLPICQYGIPVMWTTNEDGEFRTLIPAFSQRQSLGGESWTVFMINMKTRVIAIYSNGELWKYITTDVANEITGNIYKLAGAGQYYDCASAAFAQIISVLGEKAAAIDSGSALGLQKVSLQPDDYSGFKMALCVDQVNLNTINPDQLSDDGRVCYFDLTEEECKALLGSAEPLSIGPNGEIFWISSQDRTLMVQHEKSIVVLMQAVNRGAKDSASILAEEIKEKRFLSPYVVNGDVRWSNDGHYMFFNEWNEWFGIRFNITDPYLVDTVTGEIFIIENGRTTKEIARDSKYQYVVNGRFSLDSEHFDYVLCQHNNADEIFYILKRYNLKSGEIETIYGPDSRRIMDFLEVSQSSWFAIDVDYEGNHEIKHITKSTEGIVNSERETINWPGGTELNIYPIDKERALIKVDYASRFSNFLFVKWNMPINSEKWYSINKWLDGSILERPVENAVPEGVLRDGTGYDNYSSDILYANNVSTIIGTTKCLVSVHMNRPVSDTWEDIIQPINGILLLDFESRTVRPVYFSNDNNTILGKDRNIHTTKLLLGENRISPFQLAEQEQMPDYFVVNQDDESIVNGEISGSHGLYKCTTGDSGEFAFVPINAETNEMEVFSSITPYEGGYLINVEFIKSLGELKAYCIPEAINEERYELFTSRMTKKNKKQVSSNYSLYEPSKLDRKENKEDIVARYPNVKNETLYILKSDTSEANREKLERIFIEAGYTEEEYLFDRKNVYRSRVDERIRMRPVKTSFKPGRMGSISRTEALWLAGISDQVNSRIYKGYYDSGANRRINKVVQDDSSIDNQTVLSVLQKRNHIEFSTEAIHDLIQDSYEIDGTFYNVEVQQIEETDETLRFTLAVNLPGPPIELGSSIVFGHYEQDNNTANGKEPVEWSVIGVEGNKVYLISKYILDLQRYNIEKVDVVWETCNLRKWLNNDFYDAAFSDEEKRVMKNLSYTDTDGTWIMDNVRCPSASEVEAIWPVQQDRSAKVTEYVYALQDYTNGTIEGQWWLRSESEYNGLFRTAQDVYSSGLIGVDNFRSTTVGVRPCICLDSSAINK